MLGHAGYARLIKQVGAVFEATAEPVGSVFQVEGQVKRGGPRLDLHLRQHPPRWQGGRRRGQAQPHLEERILPQRARRVQGLDQGLKGQLLMPLSPQDHRAHPPQQLSKAGIARQVGAQHQRVFH